MEFAIVGWTLETRFLASSSVVILGDRGKLPSTWMSLSVKSIESWGYTWLSAPDAKAIEPPGEEGEMRDLRRQLPGSQWSGFGGLLTLGMHPL